MNISTAKADSQVQSCWDTKRGLFTLHNVMTNSKFMQQLGKTFYPAIAKTTNKCVVSLIPCRGVRILAHLEDQTWHIESVSLSQRPCCWWSVFGYSPTLLKCPFDCPWPQPAFWGGRSLHVEAHSSPVSGSEGCLFEHLHVLLWSWLWTQQSSCRNREVSLAKMQFSQ